ncbi:hypothetical protein GA0115233_103678 [Streptomyces sp. DI166]|nr:hypothetical protein GA0115233_103678 [Streptomyces sp. DI166]
MTKDIEAPPRGGAHPLVRVRATWDVSAGLSVVADISGDDLLNRILLQLPAGYDLLFGRPQPA